MNLSFRQARSGGDIDIDQAWRDAAALRGREHLVLLLHGYNDDAHDAEMAYNAFCNAQQALVGAGGDWAPGATVVRVFWPGDARWWIASALYYPWAVGRALDVGYALAQILTDLSRYTNTALTIDCVAHSLGNRVLLHTMANISRIARIWVRRVIHMAAAVPTWTLQSQARREPLQSGLAEEVEYGSAATSLFSEYDKVLALAFPPGEIAASTYDGEQPVALGHQLWSDGATPIGLTQLRATGANHGDYWGADSSTSPSLRRWIDETVERALNLQGASRRSTPAALPASRPPIDSRLIQARVVDATATGVPP